MTTELMKQRIRWLVEHGGIAEDAMTDVRKELRRMRVAAGAIIVLQVVTDLMLLL